jgi:dienelactone hydrolase
VTFKLTFPSPVTTEHAINNTVHCECFVPTDRKQKLPAVVMLHILGGDFELSRMCCRTLANQGIASVFLKMPYYGPRRAEGSRERMISPDPEQTVARMTQAVQDIRRAADWLLSRDEVDPNRVGITGISLGGIVASLSASIDPRFQRNCFVLAGGDFATLFMESAELDDARRAWEDEKVTAEQVGEALHEVDPVTYATRLRNRDVLMFNSKHDKVIPRLCADKLWKAAGQPQRIWWNATHYTAALYLPSGLKQMSDFFKKQPTEVHQRNNNGVPDHSTSPND